MDRVKYFFSPKRWKSFLVYILKWTLRRLGEKDYSPERHEVEQFMYRYLRCKDCLDQGYCKEPCQCKMPERMHVMTDHCPAYKWGSMKDKEEWNEFKKELGVQFFMVLDMDKVSTIS